MTSDSNPPDYPQDSPKDSPVDNAMADAKAAFQNAGFSTPEGMVALGGLILIAGWVIFDLFWREESLGSLPLTLAFVAVVLFFGKGTWTSGLASRPVLMKGIGWLLAFLGVVHLIWALRFISSYDDIGEILGLVVILAGYVVAFLGARAIKA